MHQKIGTQHHNGKTLNLTLTSNTIIAENSSIPIASYRLKGREYFVVYHIFLHWQFFPKFLSLNLNMNMNEVTFSHIW